LFYDATIQTGINKIDLPTFDKYLTKSVFCILIRLKYLKGIPMAYQVSDKTKKQTTKCSYNFACLNNNTWDTCSIERDIQRAFLAIRTKSNKSACPYWFPYGSLYYCTCPTRREIYQHYKK
jgi:hypothetical protein